MEPLDRPAVALRRHNRSSIRSALICVAVAAFGIATVAYFWRVRPRTTTERPAAGTASIPHLLREINARQDPRHFIYLNYERAMWLHDELDAKASTMTPEHRLDTALKCALEMVNGGKTERGVKMYDSIVRQLKAKAPAVWRGRGSGISILQGVAYLRLGELQNCCDKNNPNSCLLPITGSGIHTKQEGSRHAMHCLLEALKLDPDNASARWLLNIAYMTVGEYPRNVPRRWLIPVEAYGGDYPMQKFPNVAPSMGLDLLGWSGSVTMEDFEGNGLLDLAISSFRQDQPMRYFHNNGDGTFTERTRESGLAEELGGLNMITTDYNNDGRPDIVVLRGGWMDKYGHYPLSLLRNDGKGHFTDVTIEAGLLAFGPTQAAVAFDYNGDGLLDLFVGYESTDGDPVPCRLFRNNGNGTFTDVTQLCGLDIVRYVKAVVSADFTHSGRPGLYLSCATGHNILLRNDGPAAPDKSAMGPWRFTDVSREAQVDLQNNSFSCFFFDYDNDGWPDLYVGGYGSAKNVGEVAKDYLGIPTAAEKAKLYHNNRDGTFSDVTETVHLNKVILGMGINFGDLDNDGWLDFYAGTGSPDLSMLIPNRMFRNHDGKYFDEVTTTGDFGHLQKGHGIAFGDLNNNGQQDVFLVSGGAYEGDVAHDCLFVNPGNRNHWVNLSLSGVRSNRIALGAEICVTVATPQGDRRIYRTVTTGGSFGNSPLRQDIGLGNATKIKGVSIRWPASGIEQSIGGLSMDSFYKITEGDQAAKRWNVPRFRLQGTNHAGTTARM